MFGNPLLETVEFPLFPFCELIELSLFEVFGHRPTLNGSVAFGPGSVFKHKVQLSDGFGGVIRCVRCGCVLSESQAEPEIDPALLQDKSFVNGCLSKTRFPKREACEARMLRMKVRPETLHGYPCQHCGNWHLGNRRKRRRR